MSRWETKTQELIAPQIADDDLINTGYKETLHKENATILRTIGRGLDILKQGTRRHEARAKACGQAPCTLVG
jgi:hypothetical protein